jgi:transposase InsO family protein
MSLRRTIVEIDVSSMKVTEFCAQHGVSTWFFYDLRRRFAAGGVDAIEPRSRKPHTVANKTPAGIEDLIVAKRKELVDAGFDAGAESIAFHLRDVVGLPSTSTIWRVLKARGFIVADPTKAPKPKPHRFNASRANESWQLDDTGWHLADGTEVKILNTLDDHSRLLVASAAMPTCTGAATLGVLAEAATTLGWPARFQSDNAPAFRDVLGAALAELGIASAHSRPHHPQTNGKIERFHQTLKRWLAKQHAAHTLAELQTQLDLFRHHYNHHRAHRGINRRIPATVWEHAPKDGPANQPLLDPTHIHTGTITNGMLTIGATHNHQQALTVITGTACHVFIDAQLTRQLTLDPTRRDQPLHNRPGRPTQTTPLP